MPEVLTQAAAATPPSRDYITVETHVIVRCLECGQTDCATATAAATQVEKETAERARLEREVVEAAKALSGQVDRYCFEARFDISSAQAGCALLTAVTALEQFESQQK